MAGLGGPGLGGTGNKTGGNKNKTKTSFGSKVKNFAKGLKPGGYTTTGHKQQGGLNPSQYGNPTGMTVSEAMELYGVSDTASLQESMRHNPANTTWFGALIDDSEEEEVEEVAAEPVTLDLDNLYQTLLGRGPDAYGGGSIDQSARDYWNDQFTTAGGDEAALQSVISGIQGSDEFKALGLSADEYKTNPLAAQHRVQAQESISRGDGVRRGSVASYSDMFNADGTQRDDWVDVETWNQNKIESLQDQVADPEVVTNTVTEYVDRWHEPDYSEHDKQISDLQKTVTQWEKDFLDLEDIYNTTQIGYDNLYAQAAYGERPRNMTVKGVRTQNELPGYKPRTSGTGFFSRLPGAAAGLTTSSLNLA